MLLVRVLLLSESDHDATVRPHPPRVDEEAAVVDSSASIAGLANAVASSEAGEQLRVRFLQNDGEFGRAVYAANDTALKESHQAYLTFTEQVANLLNEAQRSAYEAYLSQLQGFQDAVGQQDAHLRIADLQRDQTIASTSRQQGVQQRLLDAWQKYQAEVQTVQQRGQESLRNAYKTYVKAQQHAWASIDVDALLKP
jgi:uncharacterized protein with PIN domain